MMTCIIAIETATEACSAALLIEKNGKQSTYKRFQLAPREHAKLILPMLDEILAEAQLHISDVNAIAFGRGPGAFTGLRIATGVAQGLALAVDKPTIPISSLQTMALATQQVSGSIVTTQSILVAIDARIGEVYWAEYQIIEGKLEQLGEEQLSKPEKMYKKAESLMQQPLIVVGSGWDEYIEGFHDSRPVSSKLQHIPEKFPDATEVSQLALIAFKQGDWQAVENTQPVYLRNNVAEKAKKQR